MVKSLASGFKLDEGTHADLTEIFDLLIDAFGDDEIWKATFRNCKKEDIRSWITQAFKPRLLLSDATFYKITEESTRRIVGYTGLQHPWANRPLKEEELAIANSHDMPPGIEGMNLEMLPIFIETLTFARNHGYEPQTDYHRKGTMIHPDFQKRGFGTCLTQHCNAISDKTRGRTWVTARPSSEKMFRQCGFKGVATHDAKLERWGGNKEYNVTWLLVREAPN